MFSLVNGLYQACFAAPHLNVLIVGVEGSGKTTLLERLKVTQLDTPSPRRQNEHQRPQPLRMLLIRPKDEEIGNESGNSEPPLPPAEAPVLVETPRTKRILAKAGTRRSWLCPAPPKYANAATDTDDEEEPVDAEVAIGPRIPSPLPSTLTTDESSSHVLRPLPPQPAATRFTSIGSMDSVELEEINETDAEVATINSLASAPSTPPRIQKTVVPENGTLTKSNNAEYDSKPNAKMLPLHRIRPTIGMNLAKVNICGAHCHLWDLGGRLHDLWERYYQDCDAVIFVWKVNASEPKESNTPVNGGDDTDSDDDSEMTDQKQQQILEQVRASISDDIPFLVLGHLFTVQQVQSQSETSGGGEPVDNADVDNNASLPQELPCQTDVLYSTSQVLPHYHNPYQAFFFANAANGQGVRSAMEWLVSLAKRQLRVRERLFVDREK